MNFFEHQEAARRSSRRLVVLFALAVAAIVAAVYMAVFAIFVWGKMKGQVDFPVTRLFEPRIFLGVVVGTLTVIASGTIYKIRALSGGGESIARLLGGRPLDSNTTELGERRVLNVVEEMAIASGTAVPTVFLLENERSINAFAAGFSPSEAVVGVTRGAVAHLNRDELQGVIAHEFSHVLNGDMRLSLRLIGLLHGIQVIGLIGYWILRGGSGGSSGRSGSRGKKGGGGPILALGLALLVIGYVGVFFAKLIKAALSRQREILADASSAQFTRNPTGLSGALKKIAASGASSLVNAHAEEASHMFFARGVPKNLFAALATHPPIEERIRTLEPRWDGSLPKLEALEAPAPEPKTVAAQLMAARAPGDFVAAAVAAAQGFAAAGAAARLASAPAAVAVTPQQIAAQVASAGAAHLDYARQLLASIPDPLRAEAHEPSGAGALVLALLLDGDDAVRGRQLDEVGRGGAESRAAVERLLPDVALCPREARLPLIDMTMPALRRLSPAQHREFRATVARLAAADSRRSLFEYVLERLLVRHLDAHFGRHKPKAATYYSLRLLGPSLSSVLSMVAHAGDAARAAAAFARGAELLAPLGPVLAFVPRDKSTLSALDAALGELERVTPQLKLRVLEACTAVVAEDGRIAIAEAELLRALADGLDCPLPPFLAGQSSSG